MALQLSRDEVENGAGFDLPGLWRCACALAFKAGEDFGRYGIEPTTALRLQMAERGVEAADGGGRLWPVTPEQVPGRLVVKASGARWWEDEGGHAAFIQPVLMKPGRRANAIVDLIAWHPAQPGRWRFLTGAATHLGYLPHERLGLDAPRGLRLVSTPLAWLAEPDAVCLLAYGAEMMAELAHEPEITCDCDTLAGLVEAGLRKLLPVVRVTA